MRAYAGSLVNDGPETPWIISRVRSKIPRFCDHSIFEFRRSSSGSLCVPSDPRVSPSVVIDSLEYIEKVSIDFQNYVLAGPEKFSTLSTFVCSKLAISSEFVKKLAREDPSLCLLNSRDAEFDRSPFERDQMFINIGSREWVFVHVLFKAKVLLVILRLALRSLENAQSSK